MILKWFQNAKVIFFYQSRVSVTLFCYVSCSILIQKTFVYKLLYINDGSKHLFNYYIQ